MMSKSNGSSNQKDLFKTKIVPGKAGSGNLFEEEYEVDKGPVECLGMTFPNDEKRREYFQEKLRGKLKDPEFRKIEGFPIGSDEDILSLSDSPYYTACPNPFIADFIKHYGKPYDPNKPYSREPFAVDVSEGKTDPIYKAHSYHTKVPHLAIVPSILHYTEPGDLVLDGFCGSGMTGVAAQWCDSAPEEYRRKIEGEFQKQGIGKPEWGARRAVLNDLSPAAVFIAANYNLPFDVREFARAGKQILNEAELEIGWMYRTAHVTAKDTNDYEREILKVILGEASCPSWIKIGRIEYTVWSEVFTCPNCAGEVVFLDEALDRETNHVRDTFPCPHCRLNLTKGNLQRVFETRPDPANGKPWKRVKYRPSLISYTAGGERHEKQPDAHDLEILKRIEALSLPGEIPTNRFPIERMYHGSRIEPKGFSNVHHFFLPRAAHGLAVLWRKADAHPDPRIRHMLLFFVEQAIWGMSILARYTPTHYSQVNQYLTGLYYVASQHAECSPWYILGGKLERLKKAFQNSSVSSDWSLVATGSAARSDLPDNAVDYIFTDPPFGENIYYADLNFLVESWHRLLTDAAPEAIVDKFKKKGIHEYQHLMRRCFVEYYRVLKPGRWMTMVFHNSHNAVWIAIQEALLAAGFVIASVRAFDKQQGSYRQVTSTAMKEDLIVSAYKPNGGLETRFRLESGTEEGVWDFVRTHLRQVPCTPANKGKVQIVVERTEHKLYDQMVAFHVQRGAMVPLSAAEFFLGLAKRESAFAKRDDMWFLQDQLAEYHRWREKVKDIGQLDLIPRDEASAIQWLRQELRSFPRTLQDLTPLFLRLTDWFRHEKPVELRELLEQNFLCYDGNGDVPSQIHSYLSTNFKELRKLRKDDEILRAKGKDRWYVPDPNKAGDLEKLRERALLREFHEYRGSEQKRLKVFRLEAVRAGFKKAWQERDYATIIAVANKIPEKVLQEDPKLLMWYDQALTRSGEDL